MFRIVPDRRCHLDIFYGITAESSPMEASLSSLSHGVRVQRHRLAGCSQVMAIPSQETVHSQPGWNTDFINLSTVAYYYYYIFTSFH